MKVVLTITKHKLVTWFLRFTCKHIVITWGKGHRGKAITFIFQRWYLWINNYKILELGYVYKGRLRKLIKQNKIMFEAGRNRQCSQDSRCIFFFNFVNLQNREFQCHNSLFFMIYGMLLIIFYVWKNFKLNMFLRKQYFLLFLWIILWKKCDRIFSPKYNIVL